MKYWELFTINLKIIYRNPSGLFFIIIMPLALYTGVSILPINQFVKLEINYSHYLLPGILSMVIMQGGIYGLAYAMVDLRARGVLKRFKATPVNPLAIIAGLLTARVVITIVQAGILTLFAVLIFKAPFAWNVISALIFIILGGGVFLLIGLLISVVAKTYEAAAPITAALGLPLTFLGDIFYPVSTLPHSLQIVAKILPITYLSDGLRTVFLEPFTFSAISQDLLILTIWIIVISSTVAWTFSLED